MKRKKANMVVVCVLVGLLLICGACATKPAVPTEKGDVRIGHINALTGTAAETGLQIAAGARDYVRWKNERDGGIAGHPVKLIEYDGKYAANEEMVGYQKLVELDKAHIFGAIGSSGGSVMIREHLNKDKLVGFGLAEPRNVFPCEGSYVFHCTSMYAIEWRNAVKWIRDNWKGDTPPRIGCHIMDLAPGHSAMKGLKLGLDEAGWELFIEQYSGIGSVDFTSDVTQIKNADLDYLFVVQVSSPYTALNRGLAAMGVFPRTKQIGFSGVSFSPGVPDSAGDKGIGSIFAPTPYALWPDTSIKGIKLIRELNAQWHPDSTKDRQWDYFVGWVGLNMACESVELAIKEVGYENMTGEVMKNLLESGEEIDTMGLTQPIKFSVQDHSFPPVTRMAVWEGTSNKVWASASDWLKGTPLTAEQRKAEYWQQ